VKVTSDNENRGASKGEDSEEENTNKEIPDQGQDNFFRLPHITLPIVKRTPRHGKLVIDCSKSIWMTQSDYLNSLEELANWREATTQEKERKQLKVISNKTRKDPERRQKEASKLQ